METASELIDSNRYRYVRFEQTNLHGMSVSKTVPVRHFDRFAREGLNFFGGLLGLDVQAGVPAGTGYMEERHFADQLIFPDLSTVRPVPWVDETAAVICEPRWYSGEPAKASPRWLARQMVERLQRLGYELRAGFEYEFYLVTRWGDERKPVFNNIEIFWTLNNNFDPQLMRKLLDNLGESGVDIITANAEYGPGQFEINYAPKVGISAADTAFIFRNSVKELAQNDHYLASFMTKPYTDHSASGCHFHHSLVQRDTGANAFYDEKADDRLSALARHWIAGILIHAPALTAIGAPTINCAKRYRVNSFAPMNATWGYEDRTAAVRVKGGAGDRMHIEDRMPCAASNPYLVMAAVLAAGLDGIERQLVPPPPTTRVAYLDEEAPKLPTTLDAALEAFEADEALRAYLGDEFVTLYLAVKRHEIAKARQYIHDYGVAGWHTVVTDWERDNYFEYL
jgi:glutamine synthetase